MINIAILVGRIGKNLPTAIETSRKDWKIFFSVATERAYFNAKKGEPAKEVEWHQICCFVKSITQGKAKILMSLKTGDTVSIVGKNRTRLYMGKDGEKRYDRYVDITDYDSRFDVVKRAGKYVPEVVKVEPDPPRQQYMGEEQPDIYTPEGEMPFSDI